MPPKLCPKIVLEGTRLTHKTDIAFELDITDDNIPRAVDSIADWMERTGGLWAK